MLTEIIRADAPPQDKGYYDKAGAHWWDHGLQRWLPTTSREDVAEVRLERLEQTGWADRLPTGLRRYAPRRYRFVAEMSSTDPCWPAYRVVGEPFTMARLGVLAADLDSRPYDDRAMRQLEELSAVLMERGWRPAEHGEHWWSLRMTRRGVSWPIDDSRVRHTATVAA
jgi:hypothetical protein